MADSFGMVMDLCRSVRDMTLGFAKPVIDCGEPILDMFRPTCAPLIDFCKNLVAALEGK